MIAWIALDYERVVWNNSIVFSGVGGTIEDHTIFLGVITDVLTVTIILFWGNQWGNTGFYILNQRKMHHNYFDQSKMCSAYFLDRTDFVL